MNLELIQSPRFRDEIIPLVRKRSTAALGIAAPFHSVLSRLQSGSVQMPSRIGLGAAQVRPGRRHRRDKTANDPRPQWNLSPPTHVPARLAAQLRWHD